MVVGVGVAADIANTDRFLAPLVCVCPCLDFAVAAVAAVPAIASTDVDLVGTSTKEDA